MSIKRKILIIDDEADLSSMVAYQFSAKGFEVQTALDGLEGLQKAGQFKPDLILLDINMPRMGGIEFYSKISAVDGSPLYPVMVITARANVEGLFKDLPINGFMTKPFEIDELIAQAELIINSNENNAILQQWALSSMKKVCVAQSDPEVFRSLCADVAENMNVVIPARDGRSAIERVIADLPDVAIIDLGLKDIAGDVVILRLSQIRKTMNIKYILTSPKGYFRDQKVIEQLSAKSGFLALIEYNDHKDLWGKILQTLATKNV